MPPINKSVDHTGSKRCVWRCSMKRHLAAFTPSLCNRSYSQDFSALRFGRKLFQRLQEVVKQFAILLLVILWLAKFAAAQVTSPTEDVLGAHNVYGRGCVACHAPHNGVPGNGAKSSKNSGRIALWGQDLTPHYGISLTFGSQSARWIQRYGAGDQPRGASVQFRGRLLRPSFLSELPRW